MKKKFTNAFCTMRKVKVSFSKVRLSLVLVVLFSLQALAGYSQKYSLECKSMSVETVFEKLENLSGYSFLYLSSDVKKLKKIDYNFKDASLEEIVSYCLKASGLTYEIFNKQVVIKPVSVEKNTAVTITGRILDENGDPLPGSTVLIKNTHKGTTADKNGKYVLRVPANSVLIFSFVGFQTQEVLVGEQTEINVTMKENVTELNEVTINAGYYSVTERLKTGNITKIDGLELRKAPVADPMAALQARVPGMIITQETGQPGAAFDVEIRGRTQVDRTNGADSDPLYIIDGVPLANGGEYISRLSSAITASATNGLSPLYSLNIADIESIEILKDADATAIYGSRGANGVILITTKKGKTGAPKFNFSASTGFSFAPLPDMLSTKEYVEMRKEALKNDGLDLEEMANSTSSSTRAKVYDLVQYDTLRDENLVKQLIGGTAHTTDLQASVSGGTELTQFMLSGGYHRETNVYPIDFPNTRASGRFSLTTQSANKKFRGDFVASYTSTVNTNVPKDLTSYISLPPNYKLYEDNGELAWNEGGYITDNPLASLLQKYKVHTAILNTNMTLSYKITKDLTIKSSLGYNLITTDESLSTPSKSINPAKRTGADGKYSFGHSQFKSWIWEPQINYMKLFGKGLLSALVGATLQDEHREGYDISFWDYTDDSFIGSLTSVNGDMLHNPSSNLVDYKYQAIFARVNYNYDDKYILNLSGRRDASSRFGPDYRFSNFGAIGAAWVISRESFMKSLPFIDFAKLRTSYGVTGNDKIGDYNYQDTYEVASAFYGTATYDGIAALTPASLFKPSLHWEKNIKLEIALDVHLLKERLQISTAWYRHRSSDPLVSYPLPGVTGFSSVVANLEGVLVQNQGVELVITSENIRSKDFTWTTNFNITFPQNKLVRYPNLEESSYYTSYEIGKSLNIVKTGNYIGVNPETGLYMVEDYNENGQYDPSSIDGDFYSQYDTDPDYYGGIQNSFTYKGIRLDFLVQFTKQMGRSWFMKYTYYNTPVGYVGKNFPTLVLDRWQNPGDITGIQKYTTSASLSDRYNLEGHVPGYYSNLMYADISYVRLKNVSLSYDFPKKLVERWGLGYMRVYVQAQNLLTFSLAKGGDPEVGFSSMLPPWRTITMGIQVSL